MSVIALLVVLLYHVIDPTVTVGTWVVGLLLSLIGSLLAVDIGKDALPRKLQSGSETIIKTTMSELTPILSTVEPAYLAGALGMVSGVLGVSVAIYLQLLAADHCPPVYVGGFFVFGSALILMNVAIVNQRGVLIGDWLPVFGNALLLLAELYSIRYVSRQTTINATTQDIAAIPDEK